MMKFTYTARDQSGHTVKGNIEANDKKQAMDTIRAKNLMLLRLEVAKGGGLNLSFLSGKSRVTMDELVVFFRQLATMIDSGIPIVASLDILKDQSENPTLKGVLTDVRDGVNTGASLSDAMMKHTNVFSSLFVNMVKAGESSGTLDAILDRIAAYIEKTSALQAKIKSALVYPAVVSGMAVVITLVLIIKVIPV
ncbi:MAG TPA: type II secretion system F family protein, partial [Candidatus Omnitrophota bacterium]|nr:type II secretion system F family protein [Candidatus Omnitrophota bacterium]